MREFFELYKPKADTWALLKKISDIVEEYQRQGYMLTLRQLYYQLVAADLIPNSDKQYKRIGDIVSRARRGGLLDWDAIEDRVRQPRKASEFENLDDLVEAALRSYRLPRFKGQSQYIELWVEKDALAGVLDPIARKYHIALMVNRGYSSTSAMKAAGDRIRANCASLEVGEATVLYLGDHDPSGEDMVRDVQERLLEYANGGTLITSDGNGGLRAETSTASAKRKPMLDIVVEKLALTMAQIEEYDPPPNPAKITDSRAAAYIAEHGDESWEVDALPPRVLRQVIEDRLDELIDSDAMDVVKEQENRDKDRLREALSSLESED